jgi:hypothetical protein
VNALARLTTRQVPSGCGSPRRRDESGADYEVIESLKKLSIT